jgi:hypothetical protein
MDSMANLQADLLAKFTDLINAFNNVYNVGKYDTWGRDYLYPDHLVIEKVDDPGQYEYGDANKIIKYLNDTQTPKSGEPKNNFYPQFSSSASPQVKIHTNKNRQLVGDVTPRPNTTGVYYDTYEKYLIGDGISVHYTLRFKLLHDTWFLCTALVVHA